ncbi:MAG: AmmeMemoRadiSam system protein A [Coriobacteriia bacterium]|nr:AmmeMemoRadiSam system protein A [Coriobacteriia bacterium]
MTADVIGIIAPHPPIMVLEVGGRDVELVDDSTRAMDVARRLVEAFDPDTIVLMSPHAPLVADGFLVDDSEHLEGDLGQFGAIRPHLSLSGDPALAVAIADEARDADIGVVLRSTHVRLSPGTLDHAAIVPLSFIDRTGRWPMVELSLSWLSLSVHREFGVAIRRAAQRLGRRVAFIASGDCSHRLLPGAPAGYDPRGAEFDQLLVSYIGAGDYRALEHISPALVEGAGECGLRSFITLGGFLEGALTETRLLSYEGPWGVGYITAVVGPTALLDRAMTDAAGHKGGHRSDDESEPVALARRAIDAYVRESRVIDEEYAEGFLATRAGAFVSLHRSGDLRGCIGTIGPTRATLADEVIHNAIQAATADPRFPPLAPEELGDLEISVDVLHEPEAASMAELDPKRFGVIVSADWRRGLLLPDLEGVDTTELQVSIAMRKAGIGPRERVKLERFRVDRYY